MVPRVLEHVATDALAEREPGDLAGALGAMRDLAAHRAKGQTLVQVLSPQRSTDGWGSRYSALLVCTDDMPFLVDSVTAELAEQSLSVHLLIHPQVVVRRESDGTLTEIRDERPPTNAGIVESWMYREIDRLTDSGRRTELESAIEQVLTDVRACVEDWQPMRRACEQLARDLEWGAPPTVNPDEVRPTRELLTWLADDHFTFVGYREYTLDVVDGEDVLRPVPDSGLGLLRDGEDKSYTRLRPEAQAGAREPRLLTITKANSRSTVHRPIYMDYIGVRTFDAAGNVVGEKRFLGMLTSSAYAESVLRLPIVADKVRAVLSRSGFAAHSHSGKDLLQVLEAYPRDELFQADVDTLYDTATDVLHLTERRRAQLFVRKDEFGRFVSALVYIPRDRYNTTVRLAMENILRTAYGAESVDYTTRVSESALAQLHFVVRVPRGTSIPDVDTCRLQERLLAATRTWDERLTDAALERLDSEEALALASNYAGRFDQAYKESVDPADALDDVLALEALPDADSTAIHLYRPQDDGQSIRRLKVYRRSPLTLSEVLGTFTDLGVEVLDERPYRVRSTERAPEAFVYDFGMRGGTEADWEAQESSGDFTDAFLAVRRGLAESDTLGELVLSAKLTWRQVLILRTIARYLQQIGSAFSVEYAEAALVANPLIATELVALFEARFDPDAPAVKSSESRAAAQEAIENQILTALDDVPSLDHDRIVRAFMGVILATMRTNYFIVGDGGASPDQVALKIECAKVPAIPSPVPMAEIWVYSPTVEGVHLRFGPIARGGLRWSDRREDFRTEVLGLVKAQMVKNAVIVPTGSKGGFFAKQLPDPSVDRGAWIEAGKSAYRSFIRGLLEVTDNREGTDVVAPDRVVRHDGDDPYLVVAADKGTATFSDIANALSREYGFWLDDAFASGGAAGYDHKAMGITARGAWESVKRHFRERGVDTQSEDFTVVGVGDMSGDVFGNGMLLSEHIRLLAAFDHRHIFLDPDPDAAASFRERSRVFALDGSSWADYDTSLISEGGGVHPRTAKSISLSPQVRSALGLEQGVVSMTPAELIHAILQAPADLLWNGGIGTYIKASSESDAEIGDRANDAIRVNGNQLRCKVVGEGGNLGASQLGRVEAAMAGVQINTDAIDNSAGVGTSDREVNIKILLSDPVKSGALSMADRDELLASMTDEVAAQVLRDNYEQNVLLGNARAQSLSMLPVHQRLIHWLEERGELDRELEFLPADHELAEREQAGYGLTRPEFSVLVAYAKLALKSDLAATSIADGPWFAQTLADYFPDVLVERFAGELATHPLREEIIINSIVNSMVNRGGITFAFRAVDETGASTEKVVRAYVISREIFDLRTFTDATEALDNTVDSGVQTTLYLDFRRLLDRASRWFTSHHHAELDVGAQVEAFAGPVSQLVAELPQLLRGGELSRFEAKIAELRSSGVDESLAYRTAALLPSLPMLDVITLAQARQWDIRGTAQVYYAVSARLQVDDLLVQVAGLPRDDRWDALARAAVRDDLYATLEAVTAAIITATDAGTDPDERIEQWAAEVGAEKVADSVRGVLDLDSPSLAPLSVVLRDLRSLLR